MGAVVRIGGDDDGRAGADAGCLAHEGGHSLAGCCEHDEIGGAAQIRQRRYAGQALHLRVARIDEPQIFHPGVSQIAQHCVAEAAGAGARAHEGDTARLQEAVEVTDGHGASGRSPEHIAFRGPIRIALQQSARGAVE